MAEAVFNVDADSDSAQGKAQDETNAAASDRTGTGIDCPICLQPSVLPCKLPCGHIFCFLCVKGLHRNPRCAMCRRDFPVDYLEHPELVDPANAVQAPNSSTEASDYLWFYKGRNGWWQYDGRTCFDIEEAYKSGEKHCTILVAGYVYIVDFEQMLQQRQNDPSRQRQVKRDLASVPKKGVAGLRMSSATASELADDHTDLAAASTSADVAGDAASMAATDAAMQIASNIIDSSLAYADEYCRGGQLRRGSSTSDRAAANANNIHRELLDQVEETLNISTGGAGNAGLQERRDVDDHLELTLDDFRGLSLGGSVPESSSDDADDEGEQSGRGRRKRNRAGNSFIL